MPVSPWHTPSRTHPTPESPDRCPDFGPDAAPTPSGRAARKPATPVGILRVRRQRTWVGRRSGCSGIAGSRVWGLGATRVNPSTRNRAVSLCRRLDCFGYTASPCWAVSNMDSCSNLSSQNPVVEKHNCFSLPSFLCPSFVWSCSRRYPFVVALGCWV
jgi:hypothetical protein